MAHGTPDWGLVGPKQTTYGLDDLGEQAVRLGSPHLWDRRGDVLFWCDFRDGIDGLAWYVSGPGITTVLHAGGSVQGAFCAHGSCGPAAAEFVGLTKEFPFPITSRIGFEISHNLMAEFLHFKLAIWVRSAAGEYVGGVGFDVPGNRLEYYSAGGIWTPFGPAPNPVLSRQITHTTKLVIDGATGTYFRMIQDNDTYDLRAYALNTAGGGGTDYARVQVYAENQNMMVGFLYLDNVIVTHNEP